MMSKGQVAPLSSPKGHATLNLTILDGHFSDQVRDNLKPVMPNTPPLNLPPPHPPTLTL